MKRGADGRFQSTRAGTSRTRKIRVVRASNDTSWLVQAQMPGGPKDGSLIPSYASHIATQIWMGPQKDRDVLKCQSRTQWCLNLHEMHSAMADDVRRRVDSTGLSGLVNIMHHHIDWALISAFVERWQPDTNTFHFPFGEMTIMLHDVQYILGLPVEGAPIVERSDVASLRVDFQNFLGVGAAAFVAKPGAIWDNGGVSSQAIYERCLAERGDVDIQVQGFLLLVLGSTIFVDKSGSRIPPSCILEVKKKDV